MSRWNARPQIESMAVSILLIFCLEAELCTFEVYRPSSWIFLPLANWLHKIPTSPIEMLDATKMKKIPP